jgi:hypothetical protein
MTADIQRMDIRLIVRPGKEAMSPRMPLISASSQIPFAQLCSFSIGRYRHHKNFAI